MSNVINREARFRAIVDGNDDVADRFLVDEGLELLASYRSIVNKDIRVALKNLVMQMSRAIQESERQSEG